MCVCVRAACMCACVRLCVTGWVWERIICVYTCKLQWPILKVLCGCNKELTGLPCEVFAVTDVHKTFLSDLLTQ